MSRCATSLLPAVAGIVAIISLRLGEAGAGAQGSGEYRAPTRAAQVGTAPRGQRLWAPARCSHLRRDRPALSLEWGVAPAPPGLKTFYVQKELRYCMPVRFDEAQ